MPKPDGDPGPKPDPRPIPDPTPYPPEPAPIPAIVLVRVEAAIEKLIAIIVIREEQQTKALEEIRATVVQLSADLKPLAQDALREQGRAEARAEVQKNAEDQAKLFTSFVNHPLTRGIFYAILGAGGSFLGIKSCAGSSVLDTAQSSFVFQQWP